MSNSFFRFKQFIIHQDKCAMKVCTDACLFGAWVAAQIQNEEGKIGNILDVGSGTGLLSLMLAQKTSAQIDAVEIDEQAYLQATENFQGSSWNSRLNIHYFSIQQFHQSTDQQFNLIITNPPFFEQSLQSSDKKKNIAKHTNELGFEDLISVASRMLKPGGVFYVLLPYAEFQVFKQLTEKKGLYLNAQVNVRQTEAHNYFRTMAAFSKHQSDKIESSITIKVNNEYSQAFIDLLKDYYLYL